MRSSIGPPEYLIPIGFAYYLLAQTFGYSYSLDSKTFLIYSSLNPSEKPLFLLCSLYSSRLWAPADSHHHHHWCSKVGVNARKYRNNRQGERKKGKKKSERKRENYSRWIKQKKGELHRQQWSSITTIMDAVALCPCAGFFSIDFQSEPETKTTENKECRGSAKLSVTGLRVKTRWYLNGRNERKL